MEFCDVMRMRRALLRWTQHDLAEASRLHVRQIARYESGEQEPRLSTAAALADALGLTLDQLAGNASGWELKED